MMSQKKADGIPPERPGPFLTSDSAYGYLSTSMMWNLTPIPQPKLQVEKGKPPDGQENKGQSICPAHPSAPPPRRSGCSKAVPYPPGGQEEDTMNS